MRFKLFSKRYKNIKKYEKNKINNKKKIKYKNIISNSNDVDNKNNNNFSFIMIHLRLFRVFHYEFC